MREQEKKIQQQRTAEAISKKLMGRSGKIGTIVTTLGSAIIDHSNLGNYFTSTELYDYDSFYSNDDQDENYNIPTMGISNPVTGAPMEQPTGNEWGERNGPVEYINTREIGWNFDSLSSGVHMEIRFIKANSELSVYYKGYLVYSEVSGELVTYVPRKDWEEHINRFYMTARKKVLGQEKSQKQENIEKVNKEKTSWLTRMQKKWGL